MPKTPDFRKPELPPTTQRSWTQPTQDTAIETPTETETYTSTSEPVQHRKRGAQAFEKTHERITLWIDKRLKAQFDALAEQEGMAKTTLLNEAVTDLLRKYAKTTETPT